MTDRPTIKLLGISGSLRSGSANTAVLRALAERVNQSALATMTLFDLGQVPPYNGDLDTDTPPVGVAALRIAIGAVDGLVLATPEYNHGMSGVLKNSLDWASRPMFGSALIDKHAMTVTASPGATGGIRGHLQLREALLACSVRVTMTPEVVVAGVYQKLVDGAFVDNDILAFAEQGVARMIAEIERFR